MEPRIGSRTIWPPEVAGQALGEGLNHSPPVSDLAATGGYEEAALAALPAAGLPIARMNLRQAHDFATASGRPAKSDWPDTRVWPDGGSGAADAPSPRAMWQKRPAEWQQRRHQRVGMLGSERQRFLPGVEGARKGRKDRHRRRHAEDASRPQCPHAGRPGRGSRQGVIEADAQSAVVRRFDSDKSGLYRDSCGIDLIISSPPIPIVADRAAVRIRRAGSAGAGRCGRSDAGRRRRGHRGCRPAARTATGSGGAGRARSCAIWCPWAVSRRAR